MYARKRRLALVAGLLIALATADVAAQGGDLDAGGRAALLAAREQVWRSWFENDQPRLERLLPPKVVAINYGDTTWYDRVGVLRGAEEFARTRARLVGLAFPRTEIQSFGDVAILYSLFRVETESRGERTVDFGRATEVFVRRDGRWLNASWHLDSGR